LGRGENPLERKGGWGGKEGGFIENANNSQTAEGPEGGIPRKHRQALEKVQGRVPKSHGRFMRGYCQKVWNTHRKH